MAIITISTEIIPSPEGLDTSSAEALKETIRLLRPKHFIFPFLAHSLGTFLGCLVSVKIASSHHVRIVLIVGLFFFLGGIGNVRMIPAPAWFNILDLTLAYIPMAWIALRLGHRDAL